MRLDEPQIIRQIMIWSWWGKLPHTLLHAITGLKVEICHRQGLINGVCYINGKWRHSSQYCKHILWQDVFTVSGRDEKRLVYICKCTKQLLTGFWACYQKIPHRCRWERYKKIFDHVDERYDGQKLASSIVVIWMTIMEIISGYSASIERSQEKPYLKTTS